MVAVSRRHCGKIGSSEAYWESVAIIQGRNDSAQTRAGQQDSGCVVEIKPEGTWPTHVVLGAKQVGGQGNGFGDGCLRSGWNLRLKRGKSEKPS